MIQTHQKGLQTQQPKNTTMPRKNSQGKAIALQFRGASELSFIDHTYNATLYLMEGSKLKTGVSFMVEVDLLYEDGTLANSRALQIESKDFVIGKPLPHLQLSYRFKESSLLHGNRKFRLRARPKEKYRSLLPAVTKPIFVIKYKLNVTNSLPDHFFKDQGGRGKSMQLKVQLTDVRGNCVRLKTSMPLAVLLCYEKSRRPVPNHAEILKLMGGATPQIGTNGEAKISFRIEEVSSRHQRKKFVLCIAPDVERCPLNGNVFAVYSSAVTILSKPAGPTTRKRARQVQCFQPGISPQIGKCMEDALAASKRLRVAPSDPKQAIDDVIKWSTYTCDVLRSIQCQPIGYELNNDGSPNVDLKIYRCPSCYQSSTGQENNHTPDCTLNKILTMYTERVGPGIADILKCTKDDEESVARFFESNQSDEAAIDLASTAHQDVLAPSQTADNNPKADIEAATDLHKSPGLCALTAQDSPQLMPLLVPHLVERFSSLNSLGSEFWEDNTADSPCFLDSQRMVYYVCMKNFHNGASNMGFPAFDTSFKLTGCFQESAGLLCQNLVYLPLASLKIQAGKVRELEKEFKRSISLDTPDSTGLIKCLKDYKNLSEMKQHIARSVSSRGVCI